MFLGWAIFYLGCQSVMGWNLRFSRLTEPRNRINLLNSVPQNQEPNRNRFFRFRLFRFRFWFFRFRLFRFSVPRLTAVLNISRLISSPCRAWPTVEKQTNGKPTENGMAHEILCCASCGGPSAWLPRSWLPSAWEKVYFSSLNFYESPLFFSEFQN